MDNLAAYGSDGEDCEDEVLEPIPSTVIPGARKMSLPPPRASLGSLPPPSRPNGSSQMTSASGNPKEELEPPSPSLPAPFSVTATSIFNSLPQPSAGSSARDRKKRMVTFTPTFDTSLLDGHDDDDDGMPAKKVKREAAPQRPAGGGLSGLVSFLPAPKHTLGSGTSLGGSSAGGRKLAMDTNDTGVTNSSADTAFEHSRLPRGRNTGVTGVGNAESFSAYPPEPHYPASAPANSQESLGANGASGAYAYPPQQYPPQNHGSGGEAGGGWVQAGLGGLGREDCSAYATPHPHSNYSHTQGASGEGGAEVPVEDPLAQVFATEIRRGKRVDNLNVVEVKMADFTKGRVREDQLRVTGIAFGPAYRVSNHSSLGGACSGVCTYCAQDLGTYI